MSIEPLEISLELIPKARFHISDISNRISEQYGDFLKDYRNIFCCSLHTTAGYLEQQFCAKLGYSDRRLHKFISIFQKLFPPNAGYLHDRMELRKELSGGERERESLNADSHLAFIGAGLENCVTYANRPGSTIYFIDLDGIYKKHRRKRQTTIIAYNRQEIIYQGRFFIPITTKHSINSFNLKDPHYGLFSHLNELLDSYSIEKGLINISLGREERHAALTVNEYETLLMRNDLPRALQDPVRYMIGRGKNLIQNPALIPIKTRGYAVYDFIHLYNELMNNLQIGRSVFERVFPYLSAPASRIFRLKRHINLMVSRSAETGAGHIVQGTYQSPILLQYHRADKNFRCLEIKLWKFD